MNKKIIPKTKANTKNPPINTFLQFSFIEHNAQLCVGRFMEAETLNLALSRGSIFYSFLFTFKGSHKLLAVGWV